VLDETTTSDIGCYHSIFEHGAILFGTKSVRMCIDFWRLNNNQGNYITTHVGILFDLKIRRSTHSAQQLNASVVLISTKRMHHRYFLGHGL
jgi:hypothetical protein